MTQECQTVGEYFESTGQMPVRYDVKLVSLSFHLPFFLFYHYYYVGSEITGSKPLGRISRCGQFLGRQDQLGCAAAADAVH